MYGLNKAITYRSASELVNFQNLPIRDPKSGKLIRSLFIPRDGHVLVEIDYSGIEVRIAACYNEDPVLVDYISDPTKDMHRDMAAKIYCCTKDQVNKLTRYFSKNQFVFPEFYGSYYIDCARNIWEMIKRHHLEVEGTPLYRWLEQRGIYKLGACDPKKTPRKGTFEHHIKEVEEQFWQVFNVYASWKKRWYKQYLREGQFATLFGFLIQGIMKRNEAINYPIQSTAFHCLLWSLIQLEKSLRMRKMRTKIIGQIHDSIVADVPVNELDDYLVLASSIMTERIRKERDWLIVPLEVEAEACGVGESWHHKKKIAIPTN
jgi:DNA polymerase-1